MIRGPHDARFYEQHHERLKRSPDNFPNNNNNLCPYSETAPFFVDFPGITQAGNYRVHVTGTVKGNAAVADQTVLRERRRHRNRRLRRSVRPIAILSSSKLNS